MFSLQFLKDGQVYSWGHNSYMQLGNGGTTASYKPCLLSKTISFKVTQIACGSHHSLVLTSEGELWAWGYNNCGQVGNLKNIFMFS